MFISNKIKKRILLLPFALMAFLAPITSLHAKEASLRDLMGPQHFFNPLSFFDDFSNSMLQHSAHRSGVNMFEEDQNIVVQADLPGFSKDEIEVSYDHGTLLIKGKKQEEKQNDRNYYMRSNNNYAYALDMPKNIDESILPTAEYKNGVMKITFSKSKEEKSSKIEIIEVK